MDVEKLIESVRLCGSTPKVDQCKQCTYWAGGDMSKCIPRMTLDTATALSTLRAENAQLLAYLEYEQEHANAYHEECGQWEAENEKLRAELGQVKRERDAAVSWAQKYTESIDRPCVACKHNTGDYVCTAICGNCGPMGTESCKWEFDFSGEPKED